MASYKSANGEITQAWSAGEVLAADAVFQCVEGTVAITTESEPDEFSGIRLSAGDAISISSGKTVKHRKVNSGAAILVKELV